MDIPRKMNGGSPFGREWNKMVDYLRSARPAIGSGTTTIHTPHGSIRGAQPSRFSGGAGSSSSTKKFELRSILQDYIVCRELTIDSGGTRTAGSTDVLIAKYPEVRGSVAYEEIDGVGIDYDYTGFTTDYIQRTADDGTNSEKQVIVPRYRPGSDDPRAIIFASYVENGTGVWVDDVEVMWQEFSPRAFSRKFDQS